ncbi:hypothetical protein GCM10010873_16570 [Cypionkella aquatica]|uniref:Uncharacterized protein n=1 Tax=Cypionkella aquatica TaxID=1756042 RepID=A0AA37TSK5_9RHOB|nr:DUF1799 domain-containing protein [Cypionkella aquatica]GLS86683.1 hypothetical protein GCM10010873_16570 [Cypionkella aquatica]
MDRLADSARVFGLTIETNDTFQCDGLWEDHLAGWNAWCAVSGQWRTAPLSGNWGGKVIWIGLDYASARAALDLAGLTVTPEAWADVRAIESGAIEELNRRG